ncbi:amino acid adenylation domain-containing protein, partial [Oxalobacteraceae bacterium A2-2]
MTPTTVTTASPIQREIWRQRAQRPGAASAWASVAASCPGRLDAGAARAALEALCARHDVLRASYHTDENGILCFGARAEARLLVQAPDWSDWEPARIAAEQARLCSALRADDGAGADAWLVCAALPGDRSWLLLGLPSLGADLASALLALEALADGAVPQGEAVQYADVADWLNDFQVSEELAEARAAWNPAWASRAAASSIGLQRYRTEADTEAEPALLRVDLEDWRARWSEEGPRFADAVCASLRLALAAHGGQALLARTVDLRSGALAGALGQISQTVALEVALNGGLALAAHAEAAQLEQHRDYLESYSRAGAGAFPFVFSSAAIGGSTLRIEHAHGAAEAALLEFVLVESPSQATLWIHYDRGRIAGSALRQFAAHWQDLAGERGHAGAALPGAAVALPRGRADVVTWFSASAASGRGAVMVPGPDSGAPARSVPLAEIERRANRLANHLIGAGLSRGELVALRLPSSDRFVVAMLAVLKAGAAYVPVDTALPDARVAAMLAECAPRLVIRDGVAPDGAANELDIGALEAAAHDERPPGIEIAGTDLAYVLYTSGSTGKAKGVAVPHHALANHMAWMLAEFGFGPDDVFLQRTSAGFDASIWEFWAPLLAGATLLAAPREANYDPALMGALLRGHGVSVLQLVPSLLAVLLEQGGLDGAPALRQLFLGGEALPARLAREAAQRTGCQVVNLYGPSECCIQVTYERYNADLLSEQVPIGQPIDNVTCLVLRDDGQPAAPGQEGELLVAGPCLFQGYLGQPGLTAQAVALRDGVRYYRTGDWVRVLPDQRLYFIERKDEQIKHNGYRIEPDEVARVAEACGLAAHAVCIYDRARRQLALFLAGAAAGGEAVLARLRTVLPEYMVPAVVLPVPEFPRLASGKIDRKELARRAADAAGAGYAAPANEAEAALAALWQELLGHAAPVGVDSGFFAIGGDSLLAMRLSSRITERFGVEVKMRAIFEHDTIRTLAAHIAAQGRTVSTLARREHPELPAPLSFAQQRLWFVDQLAGGSAAYNVPRAFRLHGELDAAALRSSLDAIVARHEVLRSGIAAGAQQPLQQVRAAAAAPFACTSLEELQGEAREAALAALLRREAGHRFDLGGEVLLRAHLVRLAADQHVLALNMHHIVSDGWSQGVLMHELGTLYAANAGRPVPALPPLELQYADYAIWQRTQLDGGAAAAKLAWWKERLAGLPEVHNLPLDYPRGAGHASGSATHAVLLDGALGADIAAFCRRHGVTRFIFLQGALAVLLSRYSGETDIVIGTPVSGRADRRLETLLGCFVNSLVLRNDLSDNPIFSDFLQRAKQVCLDAQANQEIPFDLLVEELNPERSLSYNPLFQVMLVSESAEGGSLSLDGLCAEAVPLEGAAAKFDLLLGAHDSADGLRLSWTYDTGLFAPASMARMAANFEQLLRAIVTRPETRVGALPLLADAERETLLHGWSDSGAVFGGPATLPALFEAQAAATPDATALRDEAETLSYAE